MSLPLYLFGSICSPTPFNSFPAEKGFGSGTFALIDSPEAFLILDFQLPAGRTHNNFHQLELIVKSGKLGILVFCQSLGGLKPRILHGFL